MWHWYCQVKIGTLWERCSNTIAFCWVHYQLYCTRKHDIAGGNVECNINDIVKIKMEYYMYHPYSFHQMLSVGFKSLRLWKLRKHDKKNNVQWHNRLNKLKVKLTSYFINLSKVNLTTFALCNIIFFITWSHNSNWPIKCCPFPSLYFEVAIC